tara:strand:- start:553 stop:855 length:303 start_codon:yes stop_codon:yes gene_type:complete
MSENYEITETRETDDQKELAATLAAWDGEEVVVTTRSSGVGRPYLQIIGRLKEFTRSGEKTGRFCVRVQTSPPMAYFDFRISDVDDAWKAANGRIIRVRL